MSAPAALGAYTVTGELGRGAMSVVYRASRDGRDYAVKVMNTAGAGGDPVLALQFRREAAALARLRHPSLVEVVELGEDGGQPYLVMTLADGESLRERLGRGTLEDAEAVSIAIDLAGALVEVHRHGLVHRDIKPANIVLGDGNARLIDFGLVTNDDSGSVAGTLHYAPPEQLGALQRPVGPTADLYALGATLFECLVGSPPLEEEGGDFVHRLTTVPAPDLRDVRPRTRPGLSRVVARLLRKDPDDRYPSASDLLRDLRRLDTLDESIHAGAEVQLSGLGGARLREEAPLVGRAREVAALEAEWARVRSGALLFAQLRGEGGSGKSRLARELALAARDHGALLLTAKCQQADRAPFGPLREIAEHLAASADRATGEDKAALVARLKRAAGEGAALVGRLSRGLALLLGGSEASLSLEPGAEQQRFYLALAGFLGRLGDPEQPLLWVLDDIQWLDDGTQQVLSLLAADSEAGHAMILATARPTDSAVTQRLQEAIDASEGRGVAAIDLAPLGRQEVADMAAAVLGDRPLDDAVTDKLTAITRGNPFSVEEYLRALLDSGALRPTAAGWTAAPEELEAIGLPDDVVALVIRRLDALTDETNALLRAAAVIGGRFDEPLLAAAAGVAPDALSRGIEAMIDGGLVERTGTALAFHHDRVREAVTERMDDAERRDAHQAVADALSASNDTSPRARYALARHYGQGHVSEHREAAAAANEEGGLTALAEHAYEPAYAMLDLARDLYGERAAANGTLLAALGRACAMTGRLEDAFTHLNAALPLASSEADRFSLEYLITLTYASQGQNDLGLRQLYRAFEYLGQPYPRGAILQALALVRIWLSALALTATGWRAESATGDDARRRRELSQLHYAGSMLALFDGDTFLSLQFIVRDFHNVHFLKPSAEKAIGTTNYGSLLGTLTLKGPMTRFTERGVAMADALGDRAAGAVCRAYQAMGHKWSGDLDGGTRMMMEALPRLARDVPGSWYTSMMITEQAYSYLHCGRAASALEHTRRYMSEQERTNNQLFTYNTLAAQHSALRILGDDQGAARVWARMAPRWAEHGEDLRLTRGQTRFESLIDRRVIEDAQVDDALPELEAQLGEDYYSLYAWELNGYIRMVQYEDAAAEHRGRARRRLIAVILNTTPRFIAPVFRCHVYVWRACLAREGGRHSAADRLLRKATTLSEGLHSPLADFRIAEQRARLARARGDAIAEFHARQALAAAREEGWTAKGEQIRAAFDLPADDADPQSRYSLASRHSRHSRRSRVGAVSRRTLAPGIWLPASTDRSARYADALLQVSLASASTLEVNTLARQALEATARVLGAERALFYLLDPDTGELTLEASAGLGGEEVSTTVVKRALETRAPVVLTGDTTGAELEAESILVLGLRSVMAAPLLFRDRVVGVVYLDNRLARGLFTDDDVELLLGLANHIAIAVETARSARGEAERAALARDIELVSAVQTMILPGAADFATAALRGAGSYRPAAKCGGDWWWVEPQDDGSVYLWMGDVNGHGAGPAMITSTVSGAFHTLRALTPDASPEAVLEQLHRRVRSLGGRFHMTMTVAHLDPAGGALTLWNAGGPPVFLQSGGEVRVLSRPGQLLGQPPGPLEPGVLREPLAHGDRLLMCTDGVLELDTPSSRRQLGARGMQRLLQGLEGATLPEVSDRIADEIQRRLAGREQPDDITTVVVAIGARAAD